VRSAPSEMISHTERAAPRRRRSSAAPSGMSAPARPTWLPSGPGIGPLLGWPGQASRQVRSILGRAGCRPSEHIGTGATRSPMPSCTLRQGLPSDLDHNTVDSRLSALLALHIFTTYHERRNVTEWSGPQQYRRPILSLLELAFDCPTQS
jgi:hypothetical protein